ncbi:hypothetical protein [Streptomyces sp. NPDC002078]
MTVIRTTQFVVIGIAVSLASVACSASSGGAASPTRSASAQGTPLSSLPRVDLTGKVSDTANPVLSPASSRVIAQVRSGPDYLIAYVTGHKCGLLVIRPDSPHAVQLQVTAAWPENPSEGSSRLPGGPYLTATSTSATPGTFASLYCGVNSEVIEYSSSATGPASGVPSGIGPVSVVKPSKSGAPIIVSVGNADTRHDVTAHYKKA